MRLLEVFLSLFNKEFHFRNGFIRDNSTFDRFVWREWSVCFRTDARWITSLQPGFMPGQGGLSYFQALFKAFAWFLSTFHRFSSPALCLGGMVPVTGTHEYDDRRLVRLSVFITVLTSFYKRVLRWLLKSSIGSHSFCFNRPHSWLFIAGSCLKTISSWSVFASSRTKLHDGSEHGYFSP